MLEAKITDGYLEVERSRGFVIQSCPRGTNGENCGEWCPLFGDVVDWECLGHRKKITICEGAEFEVVK